MAKSFAVEPAPEKIRACGHTPIMGTKGFSETFMSMPDTPENRAKLLSSIPLRRLCEAKDMANAALYLASEEAEFITGVTLEVHDGRTI